jgi:hypothetical protein
MEGSGCYNRNSSMQAASNELAMALRLRQALRVSRAARDLVVDPCRLTRRPARRSSGIHCCRRRRA